MLPQNITVRGLVIDPPLLLAPMVSLTHSALRQLIAGFGGAGLLSTEMLSAKRLPADSPALSPYLVRTPSENPLSHQLLVSTAGELPRAIDKLHSIGADAIDLNMGCPVPAAAKIGGGARLMDQPELVQTIVAEARKRTSLPLTAKIRLGTETDERTFKAFCTLLQDEGIDLLSVHARLRHDTFGRRARWEEVARIKEWLTIPVVANGGVFSVEDAKECLRLSRADGLMLGRGAVTRPWLFGEIAREVYGRTVPEQQIVLPEVFLLFTDRLQEHFRPEHRLNRLKQFTKYFAQNYAFGHHLATRVQSSASVEEALERAGLFFEQNRQAGSTETKIFDTDGH